LIKSFSFTVLVASVALLQLWLLLFLTHIVPSLTFTLTDAFHSGVFLFAAMGLVATITIDYYFSSDLGLPRWAAGLLFCLIPIVTGVFVTASYAALYLAGASEVNQRLICVTQATAIGFALAYTTGAKFLGYLR
jgi:hypothetical protein